VAVVASTGRTVADLSTATVMVPSITGFILLFVGLFITGLGVVREREQGTLEQLVDLTRATAGR
jgi:ABC-2 type transport system permease protein